MVQCLAAEALAHAFGAGSTQAAHNVAHHRMEANAMIRRIAVREDEVSFGKGEGP